VVAEELKNPASAILDIDRKVTETLRNGSMPTKEFGFPLAGNLLPWIDREVEDGQSRDAVKSGRVLPRPTKSWVTTPRFRWTVSASGSAPCVATVKPSPSS